MREHDRIRQCPDVAVQRIQVADRIDQVTNRIARDLHVEPDARFRKARPEHRRAYGLRARAEMAAAQAKMFVANAAWEAADHAVQIYGGRGWSTLS